MILRLIYQLIILYLVVLLGHGVFKEKSKMLQLTAALILIPFVLRLVLIK